MAKQQYRRLLYPFDDFSDPQYYLNEINEGRVLLVKRIFSYQEGRGIIDDLISWRNQTPAQDPTQPYPMEKRNFHMAVELDPAQSSFVPDPTMPEEYLENTTPVYLYNYRLGNINDSVLRQFLSEQTYNVLERLFDLYKKISTTNFEHGDQSGKNLYLEFSQYMPNKGFFDWHTHFKNKRNGQHVNMITLFSQHNCDHKGGGLVLRTEGGDLDTSAELDSGDSIFFGMDMLHKASKVTGGDKLDPIKRGRWISSFFYY